MELREILDQPIMKYWSLPINASKTQKQKLNDKIDSGEYIALLKKDGAFYKFSKIEKDMKLQSRTISKKTGDFVEKQDRVPAIMEALNDFPDGTIFLGEICFEDNSKISSDVVSIMGCLPKKAIEKQKTEKLYFYIFDILAYAGQPYFHRPFEERIKMFEFLSKMFVSEYIKFAEPIHENIGETISDWLSRGEEGAVLMKRDQPYLFGKRTAWSTIKVKKELAQTIDLVVMGTTEPEKFYKGKHISMHKYWLIDGQLKEGYYTEDDGVAVTRNFFNGWVGGVILGAYSDNNELIKVGVISNLTDAFYESIQEKMGMVVEVTAMEVDKERKSLRHAKLVQVREDKQAAECKYSEIFGGNV